MRSSPLASLSNLSTKAGVAKKIAAAKNELRALTAAQEPSQLADPKRIIPITQEMEVESLPAEQCLKGTSKFVANTAKGGRIHEILTQGDDFHPRDWRTRISVRVSPRTPCLIGSHQEGSARPSARFAFETGDPMHPNSQHPIRPPPHSARQVGTQRHESRRSMRVESAVSVGHMPIALWMFPTLCDQP